VVQGLSIRELENLSGVKAHTIRIWEKRYNLFNPDRTDTNIRTYSGDDLKKLLNITSVMKQGMKISKVCSLSDEEIIEIIEEIEKQDIENAKEILVNDLIVASLNCDITLFEDTFSKTVKTVGMEETIEGVIYPMLNRIGLLWSVNKLTPAQEHFASQMVRQKLFSAINSLPNKDNGCRILCYLPEAERHEIGLLYAYYLIKKSGNVCVYLGADVPLNGVQECVENAQINMVLTLFMLPRKDEVLLSYLRDIDTHIKVDTIFIGGINQESIKNERFKRINFLEKIDDLRKQL
jgi:DNA-binding transcriptional MerR regulator